MQLTHLPSHRQATTLAPWSLTTKLAHCQHPGTLGDQLPEGSWPPDRLPGHLADRTASLTGHCQDLGPLVHGLADRPTISLLISHYKDSGPLADKTL